MRRVCEAVCECRSHSRLNAASTSVNRACLTVKPLWPISLPTEVVPFRPHPFAPSSLPENVYNVHTSTYMTTQDSNRYNMYANASHDGHDDTSELRPAFASPWLHPTTRSNVPKKSPLITFLSSACPPRPSHAVFPRARDSLCRG